MRKAEGRSAGGFRNGALSEDRCYPPVALEAVLEANALDQIAQFALTRVIAASGKVPVIGRAQHACESAQVLHIGLRAGCFQRHGSIT